MTPCIKQREGLSKMCDQCNATRAMIAGLAHAGCGVTVVPPLGEDGHIVGEWEVRDQDTILNLIASSGIVLSHLLAMYSGDKLNLLTQVVSHIVDDLNDRNPTHSAPERSQ